MMQNDKVQKWVDSIPTQNGDDDVHEINSAEDELQVSNGKAGDDMTLGAEAKCVLLYVDEIEGTEGQKQVKNTDRILNGVEDSAIPHPPGARCGSGGAAQKLKKRFLLQQQDSFNSEASSYRTIDSLDQILLERRGNPEKILENLGFVGKFVNRFQRIPERYLETTSNANGISVEKFVDNNPWLKEYLEQKAALKKPFEDITPAKDKESLPDETPVVPAETGRVAGKRLTAFHEVASTVAMITRFRNLVRRINNRGAPEPDATLVEPILRNSTRGSRFWSILSTENCTFLDQMGYYDMQMEKQSRMKEKQTKFFKAASVMKNKLSGGNGLKSTTQEPVATGQSDLNMHSKQTEKLDKILRSRTDEKVKEKSEKTAEKVEPTTPKDTRFCVPQRFLTSQSQLFGSVQPMTGESISEIVRRTSECNFDFSSVSELHHFPVISEPQETLKDVNANSLVDLPVIEINLVRDREPSTANDSLEYEWQRTSMSSTATEDSSGSEVDDRFACFQRDSFDLPGFTLDDLGPPSLKVPSDALSVISSHTLQDNENLDPSSDHDTFTDALQISQDSVSMSVGESGVIQFSTSQQTDDQLAMDHHDGSARQCNEKDISTDSLPPVVTFSTKIRGVLRRQGSSQSDSSGFADSDHVEAADSTSLNKVKYINRMVKLDAISSQDSTSVDEDSAFSLQNDHYGNERSLEKSSGHDLNRDSPNRLRILTGDYRNEFWSTRRSIQTQTEWISSVNNEENRYHKTNELSSQELCSAVSLKDKFLSQPEIYTTRLYIDSLAKTSIPLVERTEVMVIVDGSAGDVVKKKSTQLCSGNLFSSVDIKVVNTEDGHQHLTPVLFRSGESSTVRSSEKEQFCPVHKRRRLSLDSDRTANVISPLSTECYHLMKTDDISSSRHPPLDSTNHQILHSLLKQSVFISPQSAASLLPPSHWSTFGNADISLKQHLVEEVKLLQHALQKYRLEMKVLQMQAKKLYMEDTGCLLPEERNGLIMMEELRDAISKELDNLDTQLSQRMKLVISVSPAVDLSCLSVVQQMTELLKEQIYHSNIINGMSTILPASHHLSSEGVSDAATSRDNLLLDRIASLEKKMEEQSRTVQVFLSGALKQIQEMMGKEVLSQASTTPASLPDKLM